MTCQTAPVITICTRFGSSRRQIYDGQGGASLMEPSLPFTRSNASPNHRRSKKPKTQVVLHSSLIQVSAQDQIFLRRLPLERKLFSVSAWILCFILFPPSNSCPMIPWTVSSFLSFFLFAKCSKSSRREFGVCILTAPYRLTRAASCRSFHVRALFCAGRSCVWCLFRWWKHR